MIKYLGTLERGKVPEKIRLSNNAIKSWETGYNKEYDVIIISKDGTLGEIYYMSGIYVGFPEIPKDRTKIINWDKTEKSQVWRRQEPPKGITDKTQYDVKYEDYIFEEIRRRNEGVWVYLNGVAVYLTGTSYFFYQWNRLDEGYPDFRVIQNELLIYWEATKVDQRSYGIIYVKNRRFGWTSICNCEMIDSGTTNENKQLGLLSKTGKDAKGNFSRLVRTFKKLPAFFMPIWDGTTSPKTELIFAEPTRKKKRDDDDIGMDEGLDTVISWHNTVMNAMDGDKIFRSSLDESAKFAKDCPFDEYWSIVKTSHRQGKRIVGKSMVGSTVNAMSKGGREFKNVYDQSDPTKRNQNDQTTSGLYRLLIPAQYCLEGFFDVYGFSIADDPKEPIKTDLGEYITTGANTHIENDLLGLKDNPKEYNEYLRQNPRSEKEAFRDESSDCDFNLMKIIDQEEHNEYECGYNENGSNDIERGNFTWENGIQDTIAVWNPNPLGRFWIASGCHPPIEFRNKKEMLTKNGITSWSPLAGHIASAGTDPYNRSQGADGRGSKGAIHIQTTFNTTDLPNDAYIVEYIDRASTVELFFEDVLLLLVYYSVPMLAELSNEKFLSMIKDRGYRHYSLNTPFKLWKDMTPTEKEYGGASAQDSKIGLQQFYAIESYIENYVGYAMTDTYRPIGTIGFMPFNRTLKQWREVDTKTPGGRTKQDGFISSSLAALANQRRTLTVKKDEKPRRNPFTQYNNEGQISVAL